MSPQRLLSRRRLSAVAIIILAGTTYPAGPIGAQRISRLMPIYESMMRKTEPDPLGRFSEGSGFSAFGSSILPHMPAFGGAHRATISKQPLTHFEYPDLSMPPP
jgi:hypothetical protein